MSTVSRTRWQFRIRTLLIVIAVFAVLFACYREMVGRLVQGSGGSNTVFFVVLSPDDVRGLNESFDHSAFAALVQRRLERVEKQHQLEPTDFSVYLMKVEGEVCIKYDYDGWGRSRFDVFQLRYVFDVTDPVAQARNDAIEGAVFDASKDWAEDQPAVVRIEHHGRMHQIASKTP